MTAPYLKFERLLDSEEVRTTNIAVETTLFGVVHINEPEVRSFILETSEIERKLDFIFSKPTVLDLLERHQLKIENAYIADQKIYENKSKILGEVPYISHTDKNRRKKIFIYLTDCTEKDGPIWINEKPVPARAGDMLFFDTDTPHFAGPAEKNSFRRVIRLDCFNNTEIRKDDYVSSLSYKFYKNFPFIYRLAFLFLKGEFKNKKRKISDHLLNKLT